MSRYIDANKFKGNLKTDKYGHTDVNEVGKALDKSIVDVVEVVRCKDCKKYMTIHCTCDGCCISDEWYCADGERKDK